MSRWYRAYSGTVKDDKLAEVSVIAGCSRSVAIATWHAILESAADTQEGGRFDTTPRRVAAVLGEPALVTEQVFAAMRELGMIGDDGVTAWKDRQFESDSSTERSRRHREAKRNADATLQDRCATPPDTEADPEGKAQKIDDEKIIHLNSSSPPPARRAERKARYPFPSDRSIHFGVFGDICKQEAPGVDRDVIAAAFRSWARRERIPFDREDIERVFRAFARQHRVSGRRA